ncbi:MAG: hypothetical protein RLY56_1854 [Pseudomonadota bacterium]|jgi:uncharacterized membrane protein YecN with MAPEG domain
MITGIYAGICGLLLGVLYVRISQRRLTTKIGVGSGGDAELEQRVRAHGNLVESAPFALVLLYLIEQTGLSSTYIHVFGAAFVFARLAHAQGMSTTTGRSAGRFYGSLGTVILLFVMSALLIARSIGV